MLDKNLFEKFQFSNREVVLKGVDLLKSLEEENWLSYPVVLVCYELNNVLVTIAYKLLSFLIHNFGKLSLNEFGNVKILFPTHRFEEFKGHLIFIFTPPCEWSLCFSLFNRELSRLDILFCCEFYFLFLHIIFRIWAFIWWRFFKWFLVFFFKTLFFSEQSSFLMMISLLDSILGVDLNVIFSYVLISFVSSMISVHFGRVISDDPDVSSCSNAASSFTSLTGRMISWFIKYSSLFIGLRISQFISSSHLFKSFWATMSSKLKLLKEGKWLM